MNRLAPKQFRLVFWAAAVFGAAYVGLIGLEPYPGHFVLKATPMLLLATLAWQRRIGPVIVVAFVAAAIGDALLAIDRSGLLPHALGAFLLTQIGYLAHFVPRRRITLVRSVAASIVAALALGYLLVFVAPALSGVLRLAVPIYGAVLAAMAAAAILSRLPIQVAAGATLFVLSDSLIALNQFLAPFPYAATAIVSSYFLAQLLIAHGILLSPAGEPGLAALTEADARLPGVAA